MLSQQCDTLLLACAYVMGRAAGGSGLTAATGAAEATRCPIGSSATFRFNVDRNCSGRPPRLLQYAAAPSTADL